jgi:two-component system, OmpR family, response regulator MprA
MRALVIDDDRAVRDALRRALILERYDVQAAEGGLEGLQRVDETRPDVIVLDVMMPDVDGLEVCRRLRLQGDRTPILMLTARDAVSDRIDGLDAGADDYLVKPFDVGELTARVRALLRRTNNEVGGERLQVGELELDADVHGARFGSEVAELTRTEYQLLELLMLNARRVLPHSLIYERVWGYDFGPSSNALRVYIGYLRRKLADLGAPDLIQNVRGVGYVLRDAES